MKHLPAIFCLSLLLTGYAQSQADSQFAGMGGREIIEAIRSDWRPANPIVSSADINTAMATYAKISDDQYRDYFSSTWATSISQLRPAAVAPILWWGESADDYALVKTDLHNILPSNPEATAKRSDYPPGNLTEVTYANGSFKVGIGLISGFETNLYQPDDDLKGDFARIYMYMATVYPQSLWHSRGTMLYADGFYPLLTTYGRNTLLEWHRNDPVDEAEILRNQVIFESQGNHNPFISYPDLAEYIWGRHSDETYPSLPDTPDDPNEPVPPPTTDDTEDEPIMLKAVYSVSSDGRIDFRSPYVLAGSKWTLDGRTVDNQSISLTSKDVGRHEITYTNNKSHGKIIITVEP